MELQPASSANPWGSDMGTQQIDPYLQSLQSGENAMIGQQAAYTNALPGMQQNLSSATQGATNYQNQSAPYPSYPNIAGAGSQTAGQGSGSGFAGIQSVPQMPALPVTSQAGSTDSGADTSHGFNPWSLTGEAMTRKG